MGMAVYTTRSNMDSDRQRPLVRFTWLIADRYKAILGRNTFNQGNRAAVLSAVDLRHDDCFTGRERGWRSWDNPVGCHLAKLEHVLSALQPQPDSGRITSG